MHMNSYSLNPENWLIYKSGWTTILDSSSYELNTSHSKCIGWTNIITNEEDFYMNELTATNEQPLHNELVFEKNGEAVTDSLMIAEMFGKRHDNVLSDIKLQIEYAGEEFSLLNFQESNYKTDRGRSYPKVQFNRGSIYISCFWL